MLGNTAWLWGAAATLAVPSLLARYLLQISSPPRVDLLTGPYEEEELALRQHKSLAKLPQK